MTTITVSDKIAGITAGKTLKVNSQRGVLAGDADASGYSLSVTALETATGSVAMTGNTATIQGVYGTLTMYADGSYSYAASSNIALPVYGIVEDSFTFSVADGHGNTAQAALTLAVTRPGLHDVAGTAGHTLYGGNAPTEYDRTARPVRRGQLHDVERRPRRDHRRRSADACRYGAVPVGARSRAALD
jgi:VCBS repeat-containing protein